MPGPKNLYQWDEKGRLTSIVQKQSSTTVPVRRISYYYDGNDRVIGRRAEYASWIAPLGDPSLLTWQLEDRANILAADGLPADTTFAWDPISDTLVEVFKAGSTMATDANGGLLRQVLHGGLTYDDPIETTLPNPATPASAVLRLYPVFDEAGDGTLQAALNVNGEVVSRNVPGDASGGENGDLAGGAIDRVSVKATKDSSGTLQSVQVSVRSTEALAAATVATGLRLATVDANGTVVRTSAVTPAMGDAYTASFTLTGAQWTALTDRTAATSGGPVPQALSIAVTSSLRAQAWSSGLPILPPPDWAQATKPVFSSPSYPVEVRESLTSLATFVTGLGNSAIDTRKLYEIDALSLAASAPGGGGNDILDQVLASRFQALPFSDPATGMIYARNRWYDPTTGLWLTPDPLGYKDSSNLYSFAGGDPVNGRDPTGMADKKKKTDDTVVNFILRNAPGAKPIVPVPFYNFVVRKTDVGNPAIEGFVGAKQAATAEPWEAIFRDRYQTQWLPASEHPLGAGGYEGTWWVVDKKTASENGGTIVSHEQLKANVQSAVDRDLLSQERAKNWLKNQTTKKPLAENVPFREFEVEMADIPPVAVRSYGSNATMIGFRGLMFVGMALSANDLRKASEESARQGSLKPFGEELKQQAFSWGGSLTGCALGSEAGPFGCLAGGLVGGFGASAVLNATPVAVYHPKMPCDACHNGQNNRTN